MGMDLRAVGRQGWALRVDPELGAVTALGEGLVARGDGLFPRVEAAGGQHLPIVVGRATERPAGIDALLLILIPGLDRSWAVGGGGNLRRRGGGGQGLDFVLLQGQPATAILDFVQVPIDTYVFGGDEGLGSKSLTRFPGCPGRINKFCPTSCPSRLNIRFTIIFLALRTEK